MTSQISYVKLIRQGFCQRGWTFVLTMLMSLTALPLIMMINIENKIQWMQESNGFTKVELLQWYRNEIGPGNSNVAVLVILSALLLGVTGFSYLHSREKTDFYHSLPMTRQHLLLGNYFSGALMFVISYSVGYLLALFIGRANQITFAGEMQWYMKSFLIVVAAFLMLYTLVVLAMILTGKILSGIVLGVLFWTYGSIVAYIIGQLCRRYYITYYYEKAENIAFSPMAAYINFAGSGYQTEIPGLGWCAAVLAVTAVAGAAALVSYKFRPTEAAGSVLAFSKLEGIFKVLVSIPGALLIGLLVSVYAADADKWFLVSCVLAAVLLTLVIEFVYHLDMKNVFRVKFPIVFSAAAVIICFFMFKYDFIGYDEYMPKEAQVKGISVKFEHLLQYFGDQGMFCPETRYLDRLEIAYNPEIYDVLTEIVQEQKTFAEEIEEWDTVYSGITVMYHLDDGRKVYRNYSIPEKDGKMFAKMMMEEKAYSEKVLNIDELMQCTFHEGYIRDLKDYDSVLMYTQEEMKELLLAYAEDLRTARLDELTEDKIAAEFSINYSWKTGVYSNGMEYFPIYESFENVTEYLEQTGYRLNEGFTPSEVVSMTIEDYRDKENPEAYAPYCEKIVISSEEEIKKFFPHLRKMDLAGIWNGGSNMKSVATVDVRVVWKDGSMSTYSLDEEGVTLL